MKPHEELKKLREELNLTQQDVATRMGQRKQAVQRLEQGGDARVGTLQKWAKALGAEYEGRIIRKPKD